MARYLISEAARQTGVEAHVLRFWEEELELEIPRNELGHRYYTEEHIAIFNHIREMKAQGLQLRAIKESLARAAESRRTQAAREAAASAGEDAAAEKTVSENPAAEKVPSESTQPGRQSSAGVPDKLSASELTALNRQDKMVEFESIVYDIVTEALRNNNERLGREVSERVNDKVVKEMNYLMRENEDRMEEHFRKLDEALIRKGRKIKTKEDKEAAATKVTKLPVISQTKRKRRLFGRKRKTTIY